MTLLLVPLAVAGLMVQVRATKCAQAPAAWAAKNSYRVFHDDLFSHIMVYNDSPAALDIIMKGEVFFR